jgi:hypothetical protein
MAAAFLTLTLQLPVVNTCCQKMAVHFAGTEWLSPVAVAWTRMCCYSCACWKCEQQIYREAKALIKCCGVKMFKRKYYVCKMFIKKMILTS